MMVDIFSNFDDQNFTFLCFSPIVWFMGISPVLVIHSKYWVSGSRFINFLYVIQGFMNGQVSRTLGKNISGFSNVIVSVFILLIMVNLLGLLPYVFSLSSHLSFAFCLGLPFWLSLILSGSFSSISSVVSHFLPPGAPGVLSPFMVLVETVSIFVRPVTLSIRLVANMSAGHIILGLVGSYLSVGIFSYSVGVVLILILVQVFYSMFEVGISLIQAYIFSLLVTLYSEDHPF
uniref:ATP synthase subunit a n=1 Tax=Nuttallochiton mirandus TaxID=256062 RepID=A0A6H1PGG0_NULMI|nr:ATP synthase F0 subunit 6 [Nuttallochiton mirandus]